MKPDLAAINSLSREAFVSLLGGIYEHSSWVAAEAWNQRPFATPSELQMAMQAAVEAAGERRQMELICAHPDLVGNAAREGRLTASSSKEQADAGLGDLSPAEIARFNDYNTRYHEKFGFPFIICARENKKDAILAAFPKRLAHPPPVEKETALREIGKIASFRIADLLDLST